MSYYREKLWLLDAAFAVLEGRAVYPIGSLYQRERTKGMIAYMIMQIRKAAK